MADLKIFCDGIEQEALDQIGNLAACEAYKDAKIRIMPDSHAGIGCTIGTTMVVQDKLTPNLVGVDIGCGMLVAELGKVDVDPARLEKIITTGVPSGKNVRGEEIPETQEALALIDALRCNPGKRAYHGLSIGTLGGGNHFIELDKDDEGNSYLVIHTGSRNLGTRVCFSYQELADKECAGLGKQAVAEMIAKLKAEGRAAEIQAMLKSLPKGGARRFKGLHRASRGQELRGLHPRYGPLPAVRRAQPPRNRAHHPRGARAYARPHLGDDPQLHRHRAYDPPQRGHLRAGGGARHHPYEYA